MGKHRDSNPPDLEDQIPCIPPRCDRSFLRRRSTGINSKTLLLLIVACLHVAEGADILKKLLTAKQELLGLKDSFKFCGANGKPFTFDGKPVTFNEKPFIFWEISDSCHCKALQDAMGKYL